MKTRRTACWGVLSIALLGCGEAAGPIVEVAFGGAPERETELVTIDFSEAGEGPLSPTFFQERGIVFPEGSFVGFIQGDEALATAVAARFSRPATRITVRLAPAKQATARYTLTAFSASGDPLGTTSATVTQDIGDPYSGPPGYFDLTLTVPSPGASSFSVESELIRSSFPDTGPMLFGASDIFFTRAAAHPL